MGKDGIKLLIQILTQLYEEEILIDLQKRIIMLIHKKEEILQWTIQKKRSITITVMSYMRDTEIYYKFG